MKKNILPGVLFSILLTLLTWIIIFCTGCRTAKMSSHVSAEVSLVKDSLNAHVRVELHTVDSSAHERTTGDTAIGLPGESVGVTLNADQDTTVKNGNITLHTYTDRNGRRHIDCKSDSLTLVINNLVHERDFFHRSADALLASTTDASHSEVRDSSTLERVVTGGNKGIRERLQSGLLMLGLVVAGMIAGYLVRMFQKG